ncbi:TPA: exonuclease VIII, partial [Escherichia coli]
ALEMDQENSYVQNLLLAIRGMAEPTTLDNAALLRLTDAIKAVFSITKKHQPYEFKNFISAWLDTEHIDRGLLTKEWRSGNRVSRITRTASGAMEPDATEHHQDTQPLDAQSQVNSVDARYQKLRAELHEARKNIPPKNPVDADKLLAASRGEFVEGISDPNDPKWVKGIETRDSVSQNQPESEQN